jgi:hypothetical protein
MSDWFTQNIPEDIASRVIKIKISLGKNKFVERDFRPDLHIDYETLEQDLESMPQMYAYWAMVLSEAKAEVAKLERISKRRRAVITDTILKEAKKGDVPRVAEKVFRDLVEKDEKLLGIESRLILANRTMGKLWNIVEAMKIKSEALRSLAGFKRQEKRDS